MSASIPGSTARPRVRPVIRRIAIVFVVLLVPVAAHSLWDQIEMRRLIAEIDAIRAKREPVTEQQAGFGYRALTTEQRRAGSYYTAAAALALQAQGAPELAPIREWLSGAVQVRDPHERFGQSLRTLVENSEEALRLADKASTLDFNGFPPGTEYSYRVSGLASLCRLISARTLNSSLSGRGDDAIESALISLRTRRALRPVRWFAEPGTETPGILSLSRPSVEGLLRLQRALEAEDRPEESFDQFVAERARFLETVWRRYYGGRPGAPGNSTFPGRSVIERVLRPLVSRRIVTELKEWADLIEAARMPWPRKTQAVDEISRRDTADGSARPRVRWAVGIPRTAFPLFRFAVRPNALIIDRASVAALAVERFRRDNRGDLPGTLQKLVPHYVRAVPIDPITGAPLLYKTEADAYTIYSVGADQKDDGGDLTSTVLEAGQLRRGRGRDVGIRVLVQ